MLWDTFRWARSGKSEIPVQLVILYEFISIRCTRRQSFLRYWTNLLWWAFSWRSRRGSFSIWFIALWELQNREWQMVITSVHIMLLHKRSTYMIKTSKEGTHSLKPGIIDRFWWLRSRYLIWLHSWNGRSRARCSTIVASEASWSVSWNFRALSLCCLVATCVPWSHLSSR
jgi:hypothetical protein